MNTLTNTCTVLDKIQSSGNVLDQRKQASTSLEILKCKGNGKAIPLQAWTGPEGSGRLRLLDFKTIAT
jgi:hypothetical protein